MPLDAGTRLGPYALVAQIGAGGMGEVYRATDTRLNRTVAIKVLPAHFSHDPEMKSRFDREAQTIAGLNHPNICTLHDIGRERPSPDADPVDFLVMEHLEGETLSDRLARGAMPLDEALKVAIPLADALEKAHAKGVTHRDLKPGNIMLTEGGAKLLDFGLAKLTVPTTPASIASSVTAPVSPTATTPGTILGTMQYMAPEQLEGKEADARTDLFAFGAVLYEMVTGRRAFEGKSQAHLIAAIVSVQPAPVSSTQPGVPPALDFLVQRCLEKDPERRLQTATDLVHELRWIAAGGTEGSLPVPAKQRRTTIARAALAAMLLLVVALATLAWMGPRGTEAAEATRFAIDVPAMPVPEAVALSPDGRSVAYSARNAGSTALFVRPLNVDEATRLPGTEGAGRVFWSPDSQWVAFFAEGRLKRVNAEGGPPQNITETPDLLGGSWNAGDEILFASSAGLQRVRAGGGQPSPVPVESGDGQLERPREPYFLPDGRHFLFLAGSDDETAAIYAGQLDEAEATRVLTAASNPVYAEPGYLLYHRQGTLYAQPFDAGSLSLSGEEVRLADGLPLGEAGAGAFAASQNGVLAYRNSVARRATRNANLATSTGLGAEPPLQWVERNGRTEAAGEAARWIGVDLSPNGRRAAVHRHEAGGGGDIWIFDRGVQTPTKFTFDAAQDNSMPIWSPDGASIAFASLRGGTWGLYVKPSDGAGNEELVIETEFPAMPMSWSPDGRLLVFSMNDPGTSGDVWSVPVGGESGQRQATPILRTQADERNPQVSPDGRWLAYSSNLTGKSEIYIQPFPEGPGRLLVSVDGGVYPRWRGDSREVYYLNLVAFGAMMASELRVSGSSMQREVPRALFQTFYLSQTHAGGVHHAYAVSADGSRFFMPEATSVAAGTGGQQGLLGAVVAVAEDRQAAGGVSASAAPSLPITVVLDWTVAARQ